MTLYPHEVSGGMGQRAMIAMMLIADPDLLIADEPTSALDVTVQLQLLSILDALVGERGMGLIFVSHDLRLVSSFCDRILVMYAGRVVEEVAAGGLADARHPYTRGLVNCLPRLGAAAPSAAHARAPRGVGAMSAAGPPQGVPRTTRPLGGSYDAGASASRFAVSRSSTALRRGRRHVVPRGSGRELRHRRRIGVRQVDGAARDLRARAARRRNGGSSSATRASRGLPAPGTKPFRRLVQMVFQDPYGSLHPRQTVDRILAEPLAIHGVADGEARIERALDEVGLGSGFRFRYPHQLSGGQRQRDRDRARADPRAADPAARRADVVARRVGAGRGAEPARGAARAASPDVRHGEPRPRRRHASVRAADGDAARPQRRVALGGESRGAPRHRRLHAQA